MNDRLREVLPLLRPRSAEPTLFSQTVFYMLWVGLALLVVLYVARWYRLRRRRRAEFFEAGEEAGLTTSQIEFLLRVARRQRLKQPQRLLTGAHVFDRQLGRYAASLARRDLDHPRLASIGRIRTTLGFDAIPTAQALSSTRQIQRGVTVMVWQETEDHVNDGFAPWIVLERDEGSLTLAPLLRDRASAAAPAGPRPGDDISVRFWREGDTEYQFESEVIAEAEAPALLVQHAQVERMQQRDFYRIDVDMPIDIVLLAGGDDDEEESAVAVDAAITLLDRSDLEGAPDGLRIESTADMETEDEPEEEEEADPLASAPRASGRVVNLSAGGMAVVVDGALPEDAQARRWIVDPAYEGGFPLAGLDCVAVGDEQTATGLLVKLRFQSLPAAVEKEIVRGVYEHQLLVAGGRAAPEPAADPPADADEAAGP